MQKGNNKPVCLYHGSNVIVERPEIRVFGHYKDFGYGFYCTRIEHQARKWALTKKQTILSQYIVIAKQMD